MVSEKLSLHIGFYPIYILSYPYRKKCVIFESSLGDCTVHVQCTHMSNFVHIHILVLIRDLDLDRIFQYQKLTLRN